MFLLPAGLGGMTCAWRLTHARTEDHARLQIPVLIASGMEVDCPLPAVRIIERVHGL